MKKIISFFYLLLIIGISRDSLAQAPGGVNAGLTLWFKPDAGIIFSAGSTVSQWNNQAINPNLLFLSGAGGPTSQVNSEPYPFNFNTFFQYSAGAFVKGTSTLYTEVIGASEGSMFGIGTVPDQLISVASNSAASPMGVNRANSGFRANRSEFGNGVCMYSVNATPNPGNANLFGFRVSTSATPKHENTYNGHRNTGAAKVRTNISWRMGIGSFPGYYYGTNKSGEAICYNRQLNVSEFQRVETYLAIKYGITLGNNIDPGSYISSASGLLWAGDPIYQNRITVIGRDDSSGLKQLQSRSVAPGSKVMLFKGNTGGVFPLMNANNSSDFSTDLSFIAFGDNNLDTALTNCAYNDTVVKMNRTWKMVSTNYSGDVTIAIDEADFSPDVNALLYSATESFPATSSVVVPLSISGSRKYAVIPADAGFFTLTTKPISVSFEIEGENCNMVDGGRITTHVMGGLAPVNYEWAPNISNNDSMINDLEAGQYTLNLTYGPGCMINYQLSVPSKLEIEADYDILHINCFEKKNGSISIFPKNGQAPYRYKIESISDWQTDNNYSGLSGGLYYVDIEDANGCTGRDTVRVDEPSPVHWRASITNDYCNLGEANGSIDFIFLQGGNPPYTFSLNDKAIQFRNNRISNLNEGSYLFEVVDIRGCKFQERFEIEKIPCCTVRVPSAFTPNGDGKNDLFEPIHLGEVKLVKFQIFNRWGEEVHNTFQWDKGWDGRYKNKPAEIGTYFYHLIYSCETSKGSIVETKNGDVTLFR